MHKKALTIPVAFILILTSPDFGGSTWICSIFKASPGLQTTAALQVITSALPILTLQRFNAHWSEKQKRISCEMCENESVYKAACIQNKNLFIFF